MNSRDGVVVEETVRNAGDGQVVNNVVLHLLAIHAFEVASGNNAGCQRHGRTVGETVEQIVLSGHDQREEGLGILFKL